MATEDEAGKYRKKAVELWGVLITWFAIGSISLGLFLFIGSHLISSYGWWKGHFADIVLPLLDLLGGTLFVVGSVNILIEFKSAIAYARERLREALNEHSEEFKRLFDELLERDIDNKTMLEKIPDARLEKAHANIVKILSRSDFRERGMFYKTLRKDIEPLLGGVHYETANFVINNYFRKEGDLEYIESNRRIHFTIESHKEMGFDVIQERILWPVHGKTPEEIYQLDLVKVDDKVLLSRDDGKLELHPHYEELKDGECKYVFDGPKVVITPGKIFRMDINERVLVPKTDIISWTVRRGLSLRKLTVNCTFDEQCFPYLQIRGFPDEGQPEPSAHEKSCDITDWNGWMLPFHGFTIKWGLIEEKRPSS